MAMFNIVWLMYIVGLILAIPFTLIGTYAIYIIIQRWRYSHIPTPPLTSFFSGHASVIEKLKDQGPSLDPLALKSFLDLKSDIICIWIYHVPIVMVTGVENVKEVLINKSYPKPKELVLQIANPLGERYLGNGILTVCDYEPWKRKRRIFNPAFHRTYLNDLVPVFNDTCDLLFKKLRKVADGKTEVKMYDEFLKCTLNIMANAGCGLDVDFINNEPALASYAPRVMEAMQYFSYHPFYWLYPNARKYVAEIRETIRKLRKIGRDVILKRRNQLVEGKEMGKDLLSFIVKAADTEPSFTVEDLVDEYSTFFLAGHETTGGTLGISLSFIAKYPEVEQKLSDEIYKVLGNKKTVDVEDIPKLVYLGQVFKEVLRLYPIAPNTVRVVQKGCVIAGHKMPSDTDVAVSFYANQRHPEFWTDPEIFDPDRFAMGRKYSPMMNTPFAAGPRNCIGKNMAQMEAKVVMARFLQEFKFKLSPGHGTTDVCESGTLKPKFGTPGTLVFREKAC